MWLAASPDGILAISTSGDNLKLAIVKVKTCVSPEKTAQADRIAKKYNQSVIMEMIHGTNASKKINLINYWYK